MQEYVRRRSISRCLPRTGELGKSLTPHTMLCAALGSRQAFKGTAYPTGDMIRWPGSVRVDNVNSNDPRLIEPIAAVG
jgi:hypothetical protein